LSDGNTDTQQTSGRLIRGVNVVVWGGFQPFSPPVHALFWLSVVQLTTDALSSRSLQRITPPANAMVGLGWTRA
jgi:hypothetical protein